jgi:ankyrin repeat protein
MDALADCWNIADVEEALKHLPQEIDETYEIAMSRIEKLSANRRRAVKRLLLWVSHAERPLTMKELEHATAVSRGVREIRKEQIIPSKALTSMSAGLVIIDENERVRLTHKTAEDYFSKKRTTLFQDGDIEIAECCLAYLELAAFDAGPCGGPNESDDFDERLTEHPFIGYAALNWGNHARRCNSEILTPQALLFLRSKHHVESAVQAMWYTDKSSSDSWNVSAGVDALHLAAFFGLIDIVKQLLDDGADADIRDPHGTTPLIYACSQSHLDVANALLDAGAQANVVDERGATALLRSVKNSNYNLTRRIIQEADIAVNALFISFYNYSALILACWNSDAEMVKILLERPDIDVNLASPTTQWNPLLLCADEDEEDCIKLLLQHPSINKDFRDRADYTPIHYAAMSGNIASLEALLKAGADPNSMDDQGGRPLQRAIDYGEFDAVRILLQYKVDWDFTDVLGRTIFHAAAINDQAQILMLLLQTCKDMDIDVQGNGGETALHDAARGGYLTTVRVLLDHGARTDVHNKAGRSPVREAKDAGQTDVLEVLQAAREKEIALEQQRNSHYIRRADTFASQTETSLVPAVLQEDIGTLRVRIARCDPEELNEDTADFKDTALHAACGHRKADIVNMILEAGAFVDPLDVFNRTPLILACQRGDPDIVSALVQHGADVNYNKFNGLAPWEIASTECGYKAAVFLLAQPQTHIDRTSSRINNALGWAAALGDINACKRLVEAGAPLDIKNAEGMTPVQIAKSWDQEEVEKFLFEESLKHRASSSPQLPSIDTLRNQAQSMDKNNTIGHPPRRSPTSKKEFKDLVQPENGPLLTSTSEPLEDVKNALVPDWKAFIALAVLVGVLAVALTLILPLVGIHIG